MFGGDPGKIRTSDLRFRKPYWFSLHWNAWVCTRMNKSLYCNRSRQAFHCIAMHLNACFSGTRCHQKCHRSGQHEYGRGLVFSFLTRGLFIPEAAGANVSRRNTRQSRPTGTTTCHQKGYGIGKWLSPGTPRAYLQQLLIRQKVLSL
jgi:hypothetical protein